MRIHGTRNQRTDSRCIIDISRVDNEWLLRTATQPDANIKRIGSDPHGTLVSVGGLRKTSEIPKRSYIYFAVSAGVTFLIVFFLLLRYC